MIIVLLAFEMFFSKVRPVTHNLAIQQSVPGCTKYQSFEVARPVLSEGSHSAAKPECFHQLQPPFIPNNCHFFYTDKIFGE